MSRPAYRRFTRATLGALTPGLVAVALLVFLVLVLVFAVAGIVGSSVRRDLVDVVPDPAQLEGLVDRARWNVVAFMTVIALTVPLLALLGLGGAARLMSRQERQLLERAAQQERLATDLHLSHERLRALLRDSADIIAVVRADGTIAYESPAVERMLGYPETARVGRPLEEYIHPDDAMRARRMLADVVMRPWATDAGELRMRHHDGSWRVIEATLTNSLDELAVRGVVVTFRDVTERKQLEEQLSFQTFHDPLTGLASRSLFVGRVALAMGGRPDASGAAVLFIDLDDFKSINEARGHSVGDLLLMSVAERIAGAVEAHGGSAGRMGGDEFAVLIEDAGDGDAATRLAAHLLGLLKSPVVVGRDAITVRASIGVAVARRGQSTENLLSDAEMAMHLAKSEGGGRWARFDGVAAGDMIDRLTAKLDLHGALDRKELHLEYQPIVDLSSGRVVLAEALMRWSHPARGAIPPGIFIPAAEESSAIIEMGRWALREASVAGARMRAAGLDVAVSVNVSGRQLADVSLVLDVTQALAYAELPGDRFVLEITESALVRDVEASLAFLGRLRDRGIRLAIDDFGTGYSSLDYLRRFPVDILKVAHSFVAEPHPRVAGTRPDVPGDLLGLILEMARALGMVSVIEGIEHAAQLERARGLGAGLGQGFLFAPAMSIDRLIDFARERDRSAPASSAGQVGRPDLTVRGLPAGGWAYLPAKGASVR